MDTDAQGNDTQGSNATQDARGSAVDTQGSSTEQMPGADGVEELFADLLNDVEGNDAKGQGKGNSEPTFDDVFRDLLSDDAEGNDAKGQGKGNREPDRDDPFEGIFSDDHNDDDAELDNFFKDGTDQPRKRLAKGNGPEGTLTRWLARSDTCASEKDADADDFQVAFAELDDDRKTRKKRKGAPDAEVAFPELDDDKKTRKKCKGAPDAECTCPQKKKSRSRRLKTSGREPRPRKTR